MAGIPTVYDRLLRALFRLAGARSLRVPHGRDEVHVLDLPGSGTLPPLVLVHGFSATGPTQYWPLALRLRHHVRRIVMPDLPGHGASTLPAEGLDGESMSEALTHALDATVDGPALVFASSMAGGVAIQHALRRPTDVAGLMLCSPTGAPFAPDEVESFMRTFRVRNHADALAFVDRLFLERHPLRHIYAFGVRHQFNRPHLVELLERIPTMRWLSPDELAALPMPVYLLWGRADDMFPPSHVQFFRDNLPPHAVIDTPGHFGHAPFLHQAEEVGAKILAFARTLQTPAPARDSTLACRPSLG